MENNIEIWKDISNYEGLYKVSNYGKIKSYHRNTETLLTNKISGKGYQKIQLCKNGIKKQVLIHRLVAQAFIENKFNKKTVNHINGIRNDNRAENLEWATYSENNIHSIIVLGKDTSNKYLMKKVEVYKDNKLVGMFESIKECALELGIDRANACRNANGHKTKSSIKGYNIKFV